MINVNELDFSYKTFSKKEGKFSALHDFFFREYEYNKVFENLSFSIKEGGITGLLGANGAGKTTLIKILVGLLYDKKESVRVMGFTPYKKDKRYLSSIGVLFGQKSQLLWDLPAIDSLKYFKSIYSITDIEFKERINKYIHKMNLSEKLYVPVRKLSLGERTKLEILASTIHNPKLLFLDEPTLGLDIQSQIEVYSLVKELNKSGTTIIITSHYIKDIEELCDRLLIISNKKLIYDGTVDDISSYSDNRLIKVKSEKSIELEKDIFKEYSFDGKQYWKKLNVNLLSVELIKLLPIFSIENIAIEGYELNDILLEIYKGEKFQ
jgi:ABC transporter, ATP-binding protein